MLSNHGLFLYLPCLSPRGVPRRLKNNGTATFELRRIFQRILCVGRHFPRPVGLAPYPTRRSDRSWSWWHLSHLSCQLFNFSSSTRTNERRLLNSLVLLLFSRSLSSGGPGGHLGGRHTFLLPGCCAWSFWDSWWASFPTPTGYAEELAADGQQQQQWAAGMDAAGRGQVFGKAGGSSSGKVDPAAAAGPPPGRRVRPRRTTISSTSTSTSTRHGCDRW